MGKHLAAVHHMAGVLVRLAVGIGMSAAAGLLVVVAQLAAAVALAQQVAGVLAGCS